MKKKLLFSLLSVFFFCFSFLPIRAEESSYPYTIRIYSGKQGTIDGQEMVETIVQPGASISDLFSLERVQLDNDKYYVKGFKESGKDNNTMAQPLPAIAKEDADFVIVYGIKGEGTQYTIQYVDQAGNALAQPQTFYGNVGDRPVVAYRYFEGYLPQAYNLVRTLSANAAENQFTFVYAPIEQPQTTTPATPAQPTTPTTPTQPTTPAAPTTPDNQTPTEEGTTPAEDQTTTPGQDQTPTEEGTTPTTPQQPQ
ncbi:MucBP domain-containing protein, partial [Dubosiella newyorkensis]